VIEEAHASNRRCSFNCCDRSDLTGRKNVRDGTILTLTSAALGVALVAVEAGGQAGLPATPLEIHADTMTSASGLRTPSPRRSADPFRSIDGSGNNRRDVAMNAAGLPLARRMGVGYADGVGQMAAPLLAGPREISNAVAAQSVSIVNRQRASDVVWQWGQFVDHDMSLTETLGEAEPAHVPVPAGDPFFDPTGTGTAVIGFTRSAYDHETGTTTGNPRQQLNSLTGWIDASNVYGSSESRAAALRTFTSGELKTSAGELLPFNTDGLPNAPGSEGPDFFVAGDVRANEQVALTAVHTLFVREHNAIARQIARAHPDLDDEGVYQRARRLVGAEMQAITYREFLPMLLGPNALAPYRGYRPETDARIMNEFSTAAFRFGHSLLSPALRRLDRRGRSLPGGDLPLRQTFFAPQVLVRDGIAPLLRGLANQRCQELDVLVVDDVRNFLFGAPGQGGFDLASLNIQRGRDHGLPRYNDARRALRLRPKRSFAEVSANPVVQRRLATIYATPDDIDLWVGGLAEDHVGAAMVGELFHTIIREQFESLRDGDRFWYQRALSPAELEFVENTRLADIIRRNTDIRFEIGNDVFRISPPH
jgi:hypothetical protein